MKRSKVILSIFVLLLTIGSFGYYLVTHPETVDQLKNLRFIYVVPLLGLYLLFTFFLSLAVRASVSLCDKLLDYMESFKLTSSSSLANFFGPLQSGPGVRAVYLKKKHGIPIKKYGLATLYYYGLYAVFSGLFLLSGNAQWRLPLLVLLVLGALGVVYVLGLRQKRQKQSMSPHLKAASLIWLAVATFLQISCTVAIYWVELSSIGAHVTLPQVLSYTGAANLALFVSLTPGAIGFREAFLLFSQNLHHISKSDIIAANVFDRAVYILFLGLLFVWLAATHTKKQIDLKKLREVEP